MTKTDVFAGRSGGDDVANLDHLVGDDHAINE